MADPNPEREAQDLIAWTRRGISTEEARSERAALLERKKEISRSANSLGDRSGASERLNRKRFASNLERRRRKQLLEHRPKLWTRAAIAFAEMSNELVLNGLYPERTRRWRPIYERDYREGTIDFRNFSFVDNPIDTISSLRTMAEYEATHSEGRVNFHDADCPDIGPYLVLQAMNSGMLPIFSGGSMKRSTQRVLEAVGLRNALGMRFPQDWSEQSLWPLPFRQRSPQGHGKGRFLRTQTSELVASEVIARINDWLAELADMELSPEGEGLALRLAGEALNNAERHSDLDSDDGTWSIAGFMTRTQRDSAAVYPCHLALLSVGASISGSMNTAGAVTKARMAEYVRKHRSVVGSRFTEENLETVFALQDGVSRVHDALVHGRGGTGLMDIIEFFHALSSSAVQNVQPRLAIVSGSTCILLKPPYIHGVRAAAGDTLSALQSSEIAIRQPRQLWFNPTNKSDEPPDPAHVISLPAKLNGTLITMAWTTDPTLLQSTLNEAP